MVLFSTVFNCCGIVFTYEFELVALEHRIVVAVFPPAAINAQVLRTLDAVYLVGFGQVLLHDVGR